MRARFFATLLTLLALPLLAPLPAQAQCCICGTVGGAALTDPSTGRYATEGTANQVNRSSIDVCFEVADKAACIGIDRLEKDSALGIGRRCSWVTDASCSALTCPDVAAVDFGLKESIEKALGVRFKDRASLCFTPSVSIPGTDFLLSANECPGGGIKIDSTLIARYIAGLYYFIVSSIGIIAVVGIMIGGFQYLMAAGSPEKITEAKHSITSAIIGLIIALTSYLLFSTINPELVNPRNIGLQSVDEVNLERVQAMLGDETGQGQKDLATQISCPLTSIVDATASGLDPLFRISARDKRLHANAIVSLNSVVNTTLPTVRVWDGSQVVNKQTRSFEDWVKEDLGADFVTIISAFRTIEKQKALKNCYDYRTGSVCPYNCTSCNLAAEPNCNAPHVSGYGLDICIDAGDNSKNNARCDYLKDHLEPADAGKAEFSTCDSGFPGCSGKPVPGMPANAPDNQKILQEYFYKAGFGLLKCEWWHVEAPGLVGIRGGSAGKNNTNIYRQPGATYTACGAETPLE